MTEKPLSQRELKFVAEYVGPANGVGASAAKAAGYRGDAKTLTTQAQRMLAKASIRGAIAEARQQSHSEGILTAEECGTMLSGYATGLIEEPAPEGGTQKAKITDRIKALSVLAKIRGYEAPSKVELSGAVGIVPLNADQDAALSEWMLAREDPVIRARLIELRGEG